LDGIHFAVCLAAHTRLQPSDGENIGKAAVLALVP
jgi:hypothetical protein